ncbi:MAG: polysaccharide biosynthesis/export family protein, partial [Terriglobales bacterium]
MSTFIKDSYSRRVTMLAACLLVMGRLVAQTTPSKSAGDSNADAATPTHAVSTEGSTKPHDDTFVIGDDDVLAINVWKEPDVSRSIPVRSDGKISLPLAGEMQAAGLTPLALEREIASKLQSYISEPEVTVMVQQINSQKFNILGMVSKPGSFP